MRLTRILVPGPLPAGAVLTLPEAAANHVARVLRMTEGDALHVFDGEGHEFRAVVSSVQRGRVDVRIGDAVPNHNESPLHVTLMQSVARGEKMDFILQKATELGVAGITPLLAARSTVKLDVEGIAKRHTHWRAVIASACEQCGRAQLPSLRPATTLATALAADAMDGRGLRLLLSPLASSLSLPTLLTDHAAAVQHGVRLLIGPEGGFEDSEVAQALAAGFMRCRLGPRILRTETAGIAAIAALQALVGDWS